MTSSRIWFRAARMQVARVGVMLAAALAVLGQVIDFYPGAEVRWFGLAASMALASFLSRTRQLRVIAVVLVVLLAGFAWGGYLRGRQYREWLGQRTDLVCSPKIGPAKMGVSG